jgi:ABC-type multidrug transport system fused ATPase/permease subunit
MRNWASLGLARLLTGAILAAGALLVLVVIDPTLAGAAGSVLLVGTFGSVLLGRRLRHTLKDARRQRARLASDIAERIVAMPVVQAFGQIRRERRRIARRSRRLRTAMVDKAGAVGLLRGTTDLTTGLSLAAILAVAAFSGDSLEPSAIVAALSVIGILNPALGDLSRVWEFWHGYRVAADRLTDFLDATVSVKAHPGAPPLLVGAGAIAIEEVTFGDVLRNVDLRIAPGEKVAIVGTNGAGKSTLLSLMARLAAPDSGRVRIDGTDLARCNLASVRAAIGIVSPDLPLLRGTVARNIRYRKPQANVNELAAAVHLCGLDALIAELPGGLDHHIAEGGGNLSAGQRQRIGLARAVVAAPRILLLDEPDANLDAASRAVIGRILAAFEGTVVFVSHDIATVRLADRVVCLADGAIVEQGAPDELLAGVGQVSRILKPQLTRVA